MEYEAYAHIDGENQNDEISQKESSKRNCIFLLWKTLPRAATNFAQMIKSMRNYYLHKFDFILVKDIISQSALFPGSLSVKNQTKPFLLVYSFDTIHISWPGPWQMHMLNCIEPL